MFGDEGTVDSSSALRVVCLCHWSRVACELGVQPSGPLAETLVIP